MSLYEDLNDFEARARALGEKTSDPVVKGLAELVEELCVRVSNAFSGCGDVEEIAKQAAESVVDYRCRGIQ